MSSTLQVPTAIRLRLAHACLDHQAGRSGVRVLHVKGVALHPELAAGRSPSTDCDLLVDPDGVASLARELEAAGWQRVTSFEHGSVFTHAATHHHPLWGTVDLHRSFPGLDRDPSATFERLWAERGSIELGSHPCAVPSADAQRLLLLVHAARDATGHAAHDVEVSWTALDAAGRERLDTLAEELGGTVPLALATGRPERAAGRPGEHLWTALHTGAGSTAVWRARLRDARGPVERLDVLRRSLQVNPDHLTLRLGHRPSRDELRREWWARWGRALRSLRRR